VIAAISNETRYAAPNVKAEPYLLPEVRDDPAVYPPESVRASLHKGVLHDPKEERQRSRLWSRVKTGL
jgi:putrescine transport system substrate-binding protein